MAQRDRSGEHERDDGLSRVNESLLRWRLFVGMGVEATKLVDLLELHLLGTRYEPVALCTIQERIVHRFVFLLKIVDPANNLASFRIPSPSLAKTSLQRFGAGQPDHEICRPEGAGPRCRYRLIEEGPVVCGQDFLSVWFQIDALWLGCLHHEIPALSLRLFEITDESVCVMIRFSIESLGCPADVDRSACQQAETEQPEQPQSPPNPPER